MSGADWTQDLIPMLVSAACGTALGFERQAGNKPAGLRTHTLVCLGSTLFVLAARHAAALASDQNFDPTRIIHGLVTGVGFLGAGSILRHEGMVLGLTTAASIWMVAAIGATVGVGAYPLAVIGTVLALVVLRIYRMVDRWLATGSDEVEP
jgi:putative Mg2+ transporter-C (MgtC) family protein